VSISIKRSPSLKNSLEIAFIELDFPVPASPYSKTLQQGLPSTKAFVFSITFWRSLS